MVKASEDAGHKVQSDSHTIISDKPVVLESKLAVGADLVRSSHGPLRGMRWARICTSNSLSYLRRKLPLTAVLFQLPPARTWLAGEILSRSEI